MTNAQDRITGRLIELLEAGTIPWRKPWVGGPAGRPKNLVSKRPYSGINVFLLTAAGYGCPFWVTYKQAKAKGGHVRKGEKGFPVIFYKLIDVEGKDGKRDRVPLLKSYTLFNLEQCDGIDAPELPQAPITPFKPIEAAAEIADGFPSPPAISHEEARAFYRPLTDELNMPPQGSFVSPEEYYSTLFHELAHATGHTSRLGRFPDPGQATAAFGSGSYAKEELIAEIAATYLCGESGIEQTTIANSTAYIAGWITKLRAEGSRAIIQAASAASKAALFIRPEAD